MLWAVRRGSWANGCSGGRSKTMVGRAVTGLFRAVLGWGAVEIVCRALDSFLGKAVGDRTRGAWVGFNSLSMKLAREVGGR